MKTDLEKVDNTLFKALSVFASKEPLDEARRKLIDEARMTIRRLISRIDQNADNASVAQSVGITLDQLLEVPANSDFLELNILYMQCGDEDAGGNYTPPHYTITVKLGENEEYEHMEDYNLLKALEEALKVTTEGRKQKRG